MKFFYTIERFIETLKKGDLNEISHAMSSVVYKDKKIIDKNTKINLIADNICSLKLETIAQLLPIYGISYKNGTEMSLYVRSVYCSDQIFGFITSYYSVDKNTRFLAYKQALKLNKVNILKRIRGISPDNLQKLRDYSGRSPTINSSTKDFVTSDHRKSRSSKDTSPEDFLKKKLKKNLKKKIKELQEDLNKKWKFEKKSRT